MKFVAKRFNHRYSLYVLGLVLSSALLALNGFNSQVTNAQGADSIYITPAGGSYGIGANFTVSVRVNTTQQVNAAEANMSYSSNLQFVSIDGTGSAFGIDASSSGGSGTVSIARGTTNPVSGDQLVAKVTFKTLASGTGTVTMENSSQALSVASSTNVIASRAGGSYTITAPTTPTPTPTPAPTPTPTPPATTPPTASTAKPAPKATNNLPTTSITSQGSAQTTPLPGDSVAQLNAPATIETTPNSTKQVVKVEYLLNGKIVSTDTTAPYNHSIDSTSMRNGTYTLVTKTYYSDGKFDTSTAKLIVSNPFGLSQVGLQLKHYAWLVIILLIVLGEVVYLVFFKKRGGFNMPGAAPYHPPVVVNGVASGGPTIAPNAPAPVPTQNPNVQTVQPTNGGEPVKPGDTKTPPSV